MSGVSHLLSLGLITLPLFFYKEWHGGFAGAFLFYILSLLFVYELLLFFTSFHRLQVDRIIDHKRLPAGKSQKLTIQLSRRFHFPLVWYAAYEDVPGYTSIHGQVVFPWFRKKIELQYELPNLKRGLYELREITVVAGDLFGLLKMKKTYRIHQDFIVYPKYANLDKWGNRVGQKSGHESVSSSTTDEQALVVGIKEYAHGDRLSQIHWKATARNHSLKTKEFECQISNHFSVLLDTHPSSYPNKDSFEKAVSLAASLVYFGNRRNIRCSLLIERQDKRLLKLEGIHQHDFYRLLDELAILKPEGSTPIAALSERLLAGSAMGSHLVIVTPQVDRSLVSLLSNLALKKWRVEIFLVDGHTTQLSKEWLSKLQGSGVTCHRVLV